MQKTTASLALILVLTILVSCRKDKESPLPPLGTCQPVDFGPGLTHNNATNTYTYLTSGGGRVEITPNSLRMSHEEYAGFTLEFWGALGAGGQYSHNHENLNGKHIKDRIGDRRSLIFPDGTKVTWVAEGEVGRLLSIAIYDGEAAHHFNMTCGVFEYSAADATIAEALDKAEADGETSTFEFDDLGLLYKTIYTENTPGNKVPDEYMLGELIRANPTQVRDFYDDPRLGHT